MAPLPFWRWDSHSVSHFSEGGIYAVDGRLPYYSHQRQLLSLSALVDGRDARSEFVGLGGSLHLKRQEKYRESFCGGNGW